MPITPILTMEAANIYCGVTEPNDVSNSNHLRLTDVKLPGMDEQYVDHRAAGAPIAIEINTLFARLECTFTLVGWSAQVQGLIDGWGIALNQYWIFGALRDRLTGAVYQAKASIYGRLGRADPQLWRRGDVLHNAFSIRGITVYRLSIENETPIYDWDYFNNKWIVNGDDRVQDINAALQITPAPPSGAPAIPAQVQTGLTT